MTFLLRSPCVNKKFSGMIGFVLLILSQTITWSVNAQSEQVLSTSANEFVVGFMKNYVKPSNYKYAILRLNNTYLFVTTDDPAGATVTVTYGDEDTVHTITPRAPQLLSAATIQLQSGVRVQGDWDRNKGIRVKADGSKHISVQCFSEEIHSVEGYTALPCVSLPSVEEYVYYALSVPRASFDRSEDYREPHSMFLIVACKDNTEVTISPTQVIEDPLNPGSFVGPGQKFTMTLNATETLQIEHIEDLTGSRVATSEPVTFISGHECGNVPYNVSECDHLVEQLPPTATWGREFMFTTSSVRTVGDTIKVVSSQEDTKFNISCGNGQTSDIFTNHRLEGAGSVVDITLNVQSPYCYLNADGPVLVAQFTPGRYAERSASGTGDPFMLLIPPTNQYLNKVVFSSAQGFEFTALTFDNHLTLFVPESSTTFNPSSVLVNGVGLAQSSWHRVFCSSDTSSVCGFTARLMAPGQQAIQVSHTNPEGKVGVASYGLSFLETYAYTGGMKITLGEGPSIIEPEQTSFLVLHNSNLCLPCDLSHDFLSVDRIWRFNETAIALGGNIQVNENGTLCLTAASSQNAGRYTCHVGSQTLEYQVSITTGIVITSPVCRPQPTSSTKQLFGIGQSQTEYIDLNTSAIEICCPTEGMVQSIEWYADYVKVSPSSKFTIGSNYLRVSGGFQDGCITYTCTASFTSRVVSQSTEVCTGRFGPPSNVTIENPMKVIEGDSFSMTCFATGFPLPEITWSKFGELLTDRVVDHGNGTLFVSSISGDNELAEFCCDVGNARGTRTKCIHLTVLVPPQIRRPSLITNIITTNQDTLPSPETSFPVDLFDGFLTSGVWLALAGQIIMIHVNLNVRIDCLIERGSPAPVISWWKEGEKVINSSRIEVYKNGSMLIKDATEDIEGVYTCEAKTDGLKVDRLNTSVSIIVSPKIEEPSAPYHSPGSCIDATRNDTIHQQVGLDLCVQAKNTTKIYLTCETAEGVPPPNITWYLNHQSINSSREGVSIFENGTLMIEGLPVPVESTLTGQTDQSGLYTCVAVNIAGVTNTSSFILPFGGVSEDVLTGHIRPIHRALYDSLYTTVAEQVEDLSSGQQHLALLANGRILKYSDYNPGRYFDGSTDTIPENILEKIFKLTDVIPKGDSIIAEMSESHRLSETYDMLVRQLQVKPIEVSSSDMQDARDYLQEKVEDLGSNEGNLTRPRLTMYIKYKNKYYETKLDVESQINMQKNLLSGYLFSDWYDRHSNILNARIDDAYIQWVMYGYKDEVEKWLKIIKLHNGESSSIESTDSLEEVKALLVASKERSKFKEDSLYRPVKLLPDHWFRVLENRVKESIEQLQYHISNLESQKKVLEVTNDYLQQEAERAEYCDRPSVRFPIPITCPQDILDDPSSVVNQLSLVRYFLEQEVERSEMLRYRCLVTRKPNDCHLYSLEHDTVLHWMDTYADLYFVTQLVTTAQNHQDVSSPAIFSTIQSLEKRIFFLESLVQAQLLDSADREQEVEEDVFKRFDSPINFEFSSINHQKQTSTTHVQLLHEIRARFLWHFEYSSFRSQFHSDDSERDYRLVTDYLNSVYTNITADFVTVRVKRRWFKPAIFEDKHLHLKNSSIRVSPGAIYPPKDFREALENGSYLLPIYPSSMLLATNIKLTIKTPFPYFILPSLLRMSYDQYLHGGFGPFVFGEVFESATGSMKFSVSVRDSNIVISLPGTQLIGYLCDIVSQHPVEPREGGRSKRSTRRDELNRQELDKVPDRFNQWLLSRTKEEIDSNVAAILPTSTLAYTLGQVDTYGNTSVDSVMYKTDNVH